MEEGDGGGEVVGNWVRSVYGCQHCWTTSEFSTDGACGPRVRRLLKKDCSQSIQCRPRACLRLGRTNLRIALVAVRRVPRKIYIQTQPQELRLIAKGFARVRIAHVLRIIDLSWLNRKANDGGVDQEKQRITGACIRSARQRETIQAADVVAK